MKTIDSKTGPGVRKVRLRLRRHDGGIYLDRWGFEARRVGGIFLHRMTAPDPGVDLHDHPWHFWSLILWGGYTEERAPIREASLRAQCSETLERRTKMRWRRGTPIDRRPGTFKAMRLDECHRITDLHRPTVWTLVVHGPHRRTWGFYLPAGMVDEHAHDTLIEERKPAGWVDEHTYDATVRVDRRDLWNEAV